MRQYYDERKTLYEQLINPIYLEQIFSGYSENISMEEIYRVDFNSSIYQFTIQTGPHEANKTTIEVTLQYLIGMDGSEPTPSRPLRLSLLSSSKEICATFFFLWDKSVKEYLISLAMFAIGGQKIVISLTVTFNR
jgi:hypothetical protein